MKEIMHVFNETKRIVDGIYLIDMRLERRHALERNNKQTIIIK